MKEYIKDEPKANRPRKILAMYYGMGDVSDENYCSFGERSEP